MKMKGAPLFIIVVQTVAVSLIANTQDKAQRVLAMQNKRVLEQYMKTNSENLAKTAEEVIARHLEAIGGEKSLRKIKTMKVTYTFLDAIEQEPSIIRYYKYPHYVRQDNLVSGTSNATNGKKVWRVNQEGGWKELKQSPWAYTPDIYSDFVEYTQRGISFELLGVEAIDQAVYYHLIKTHKDGETRDYYFSAETGLFRMERRDFGMGKDIKSYWDFRRVEGILIPYLFIVTLDAGFDQIHGAIIKDIEINLLLEDSLFERE
jgi:hypothetical protein